MFMLKFLLSPVFFAAARLFSFPPFGLWPFAFVLYVPFLRAQKAKRLPFWTAPVQGAAAGTLISFQLFFSVWTDPFQEKAAMAVALGYFVLYYALQWGMYAAILRYGKKHSVWMLPAAAFLYSLVITWIPAIFPLFHCLSLPVEFCSVISEIGISSFDALLLLVNYLLADLLSAEGRSVFRWGRNLSLLLLLFLYCGFYPSPAFSPENSLKLVYFQGAVPQWRYSYLEYSPGTALQIADEYQEALEESPEVDGAVLPESVLLGSPERVAPYWNRIAEWCQSRESFCIGQSEYRRDDGSLSNAALLIDTEGDRSHIYEKQNLVAAEETRFYASGTRADLFRTATADIGLLICYDVMFESVYRNWRIRDADFLVALCNDTFAGASSVPYLHFAYSRLFSLQEGLPVLFVGQTGCSGFIRPDGRVTGSMEPWEKGACVVDVGF